MSLHPFYVQVRRRGGAAILDLSGEINGLADADLNAAYLEAEEAGAALVALNFAAVEYINSTGIALIVGLLAKARKARQRLAVFGLSEHYREIFHITRLEDYMAIFPDETSLLEAGQAG